MRMRWVEIEDSGYAVCSSDFMRHDIHCNELSHLWVSGVSVPRCRFASDGIFDKCQLAGFFFLKPDTRNLTPETKIAVKIKR